MKQFTRIFIIGHPGAGKAVLGKALAETLGWKFIDADTGLESQIGRPLTDILGKQGVKSFYHCMADILSRHVDEEHIVVTTDASIVCNEKTRKLLSSQFVIYLKVSTAVQLQRGARQTEPLVKPDIRAFLDKLHQERDSLYEQTAHFTINSDDSKLEEHVAVIVRNLHENRTANRASEGLKLDKKDLVLFHKSRHVPVHLSKQQAACLKLLAQGKTSKEIARDLKISYRTVEGYIAKAMQMLGCSSSKELIALYHDQP